MTDSSPNSLTEHFYLFINDMILNAHSFQIRKGNALGRFVLVALFLFAGRASAQNPSGAQNYLMETTVKAKGHQTTASLLGYPVDSVNRKITYFDGLGRPIQVVMWQGSPGKKDLVQILEYDALGRETKRYLPYAEQTMADGSFKVNAVSSVNSFYSSGSSWEPHIAKTAYPFSQAVIEPSPLNRPLEQGSPGASWQPYTTMIPGSGHTEKTAYSLNGGNEVKLWTISASGANSAAYYPAGSLYKTVSKNENWSSGPAGTTEEFRDTEGRVVLKREWNDSSLAQDTYFAYDLFGSLAYVIPPAASAAIGTGFTEVDNVFKYYVYGYHYDARNRVVEKKIPGKGWEHLVYNKLDQLVMTQDSVQRTNGQWNFIKYDAMGRAIIAGLVNSNATRQTWQQNIDAQPNNWESRDNANASGTATGYSNAVLPTSGISSYLTISYYDDYEFFGNSFGGPSGTQAPAGRTRGLLTGIRTNILGSATSMLATTYYDLDGRIIQTKAQNHLSGTDIVDNTYNFAGELIGTLRTHSVGGNTTYVSNSFTYDHFGRKRSTAENINNQGEIVLSRIDYNEVGQAWQKNLHSSNGGSSFMQSTTIAYNERGWLKESTSPQFSMQLKYDDGTYPQFNGNIANQLWGYNSVFPNSFTYTYDKLNRLLGGTSTGIVMGETLTYDAMDNIATLSRFDGTVTKNGTYNYLGNQLNYIHSGTLATDPYAYDGNGNATTDGRNKVALAYNQLNLVTTAVRSSGTPLSVSYVYDATGAKLRKTNNTTGSQTDYVDGIQYENGTLDFIQTEAGIAKNSGGIFSYRYNLTDHLGNVRYVFDIYAGAVRRLQEDDYYPLGLRRSAGSPVSLENKYLYNGKELQEELEQYDYGARFYDPVVGRFNSVDRFAERHLNLSTYQYAASNPIRNIDVNGDSVWVTHRKGFLGLGGKETLRYESGKLYNKDGTNYAGKVGGFLKKTVDALGKITSANEGANMVGELQASTNNFTIVQGESKFTNNNAQRSHAGQLRTDPAFSAQLASAASAGTNLNGGAGGTISWDPSGSVLPTTAGGKSNGVTDLAHEMFHAQDSNRGLLDTRLESGIKRDEWQAVYRENILRMQLGEPLRSHYVKNVEGETNRFLGGVGPKMISQTSIPGTSYMMSFPLKPSWYAR